MVKKKYVLLPVLLVCCLISGGCGSTGETAEDTGIHESVPAVQEEVQTEEKKELTAKPAGKTLEDEVWAADGNIFEYEIRELSAQRDRNHIYGVAYIPLDAGERIPAVISPRQRMIRMKHRRHRRNQGTHLQKIRRNRQRRKKRQWKRKLLPYPGA